MFVASTNGINLDSPIIEIGRLTNLYNKTKTKLFQARMEYTRIM